MKRFFSLLCVLALALALPARAGGLTIQFYDEGAGGYAPAQTVEEVPVLLNGEPLKADLPALLLGGRTLAPVRALAEALGATVSWDGVGRRVTLERGGDRIVLTLGSATALVNGESRPLPDGVPALLARLDGSERTLAPLRFVAETLGARVDWNDVSRTACVSTGTLAGRLVALDPGHGGSASGAAYGGVLEKDVNLAVTLRVKGLLEAKGCRVVLTRDRDRDVGLYERCRIANAAGAEVFVSVHANAAPGNSDFQGTYTYYYPGSASGAALARHIQSRTAASAGSVDRGILSENFVVVRETKMPAALVETGFMTCREELEKLTDPAYQDRLAWGIAAGIEDYLTGE